ncbi:MAG: TolC family protein [bacterium]
MNTKSFLRFFFIFLFVPIIFHAQIESNSDTLKLSLPECIDLALKNSNYRPAAEYAIQTAESRIEQAQSGHYPQLDAGLLYSRFDQDLNFIMPGMNMTIPQINLGAITLDLPPIAVPEQNVKLADKQTITADISLTLPLFTGWKISSYIQQAEAGLEAAKHDLRQAKVNITYETTRLYYAVVLTNKLVEIATEAHERLSTTLEVTKSLYEKGSGKVTKTDYLKNKTIVEAVGSFVFSIKAQNKSALAALVNAMGLDWNTKIALSNNEIQFNHTIQSLEELIGTVYNSSPLWGKVEEGLKAYNSKIDEAKSNYYPQIGLFGTYKRIFNNYDYGMVTLDNKNLWAVGIGMQISLFDGFRTSAKVDEAKANYLKLIEEKELLKKGLALQLQDLYNKLEAAIEREKSLKAAMETSTENRDLTERAYFNDLMEMQDLIQAQITESIMKAQYQYVLYEYVEIEAKIQNVLGKEFPTQN